MSESPSIPIYTASLGDEGGGGEGDGDDEGGGEGCECGVEGGAACEAEGVE